MFVRYLGTFFSQGGYEDSYGIEPTGNCSQTGFFHDFIIAASHICFVVLHDFRNFQFQFIIPGITTGECSHHIGITILI
jgi:hypothetical protein